MSDTLEVATPCALFAVRFVVFCHARIYDVSEAQVPGNCKVKGATFFSHFSRLAEL